MHPGNVATNRAGWQWCCFTNGKQSLGSNPGQSRDVAVALNRKVNRRSSLPGWTSRLAATCVHVINLCQAEFSIQRRAGPPCGDSPIRQKRPTKHSPFRQKGPTKHSPFRQKGPTKHSPFRQKRPTKHSPFRQKGPTKHSPFRQKGRTWGMSDEHSRNLCV